MIQCQARLKKTFNQKMLYLKTIGVESQPGFYLFLKVILVFILKKREKENKNLKNFYKKTIKNFKNLLKTLIIDYITLIKQNWLLKMFFLPKVFVKKPYNFIKIFGFLKNNIGCFALLKKT
tara:strand:+ start:240 stop:602 length:363 start_codon:yes stop_codon:yes gene_type:complete